ncbi:MAG TPA: translational GTPase TypA, partial [Synergistales bacterium]|nr:translational GTPase TypA [Synergistales bacterium]
MYEVEKIRNLAIIAHIDHGKTTLIDSIFRAARVFRDNARVDERVMDNNELERERGITIRSKHCTVKWKDYLINLVDTPGHADFSGEVERVLSTVDSVLLLVDANEGPMPQTRYVLRHALKMGLRPLVFINKADRPGANIDDALNKTFDLFIELGATDEQTDFPVIYGSGLQGWAVRDLADQAPEGNMDALFDMIIEHVPAPRAILDAPFLMQVTTLAWNDYSGRIGCGKVLQGSLLKGTDFLKTSSRWLDPKKQEGEWEVTGCSREKAAQLWVTRGLERVAVEEVTAGDIVWISGPKEIGIGDVFSSPEIQDPGMAPLSIEEPTISMFILVNNGPFSGQEGQAITLRQIKARIERETKSNIALHMEDLGRPDGVKISGRGELHLAILIEEMRREGSEFCVSRPEVITEIIDGKIFEPNETLTIDVPEEFQGIVFEKISRRRGRMTGMQHLPGGTMLRMEFSIPTRGLIGYRGDFLTDTRGLGIMSSCFDGYAPWAGEINPRNRGSVVSLETGEATAYQIENLQERCTLFIRPMERVYEGMIVGENSRPGDMICNPTKKKQMTNHRASTQDQYTKLDVPRTMTLEKAIEWIAQDELVEVTPSSIRIRKAILDENERKKRLH